MPKDTFITKAEKLKLVRIYKSLYQLEINRLSTGSTFSGQAKLNRISAKIFTVSLLEHLAHVEDIIFYPIGRIFNQQLLLEQAQEGAEAGGADIAEEAQQQIPAYISRLHGLIITSRAYPEQRFILECGGINGITVLREGNSQEILSSGDSAGLVFRNMIDIKAFVIGTRKIKADIDIQIPEDLQMPDSERARLPMPLLTLQEGISAALDRAQEIVRSCVMSYGRNDISDLLLTEQLVTTGGDSEDCLVGEMSREVSLSEEPYFELPSFFQLNSTLNFILDEIRFSRVTCKYPGKEILLLNTDESYWTMIIEQLKAAPDKFDLATVPILEVLHNLNSFIAEIFSNPEDKLADIAIPDRVVSLATFCQEGNGSGRHMALLGAFLLGALINDYNDHRQENPDNKFKTCSVRHYRGVTSKLTQHCIILLNYDGNTFFIDPALQKINILREQYKQKDFDKCVKVYAEAHMPWMFAQFVQRNPDISLPSRIWDGQIDPVAIERIEELMETDEVLSDKLQEFHCPLSQTLMVDPVYVFSGFPHGASDFFRKSQRHPNGLHRHTAERSYIEQWQATGRSLANTSPFNRLPIIAIVPANKLKPKLISILLEHRNIIIPEDAVVLSKAKAKAIRRKKIFADIISRQQEHTGTKRSMTPDGRGRKQNVSYPRLRGRSL